MKRYFVFDKNLNFKPVSELDNKKKAPAKKDKFSLVNMLNIGYYIITPLLVGVFLGLAIDRQLKIKGVFTLIFLFFGSVAAFYNLYKLYKNG